MKTNDLINDLWEERAGAKMLRAFYIIAAIIVVANIILLTYNKLWRDWCDLVWDCAVLCFIIGAVCRESRIIDVCTRIIDNTTDDLDTNLENAKKEEIE